MVSAPPDYPVIPSKLPPRPADPIGAGGDDAGLPAVAGQRSAQHIPEERHDPHFRDLRITLGDLVYLNI